MTLLITPSTIDAHLFESVSTITEAIKVEDTEGNLLRPQIIRVLPISSIPQVCTLPLVLHFLCVFLQ